MTERLELADLGQEPKEQRLLQVLRPGQSLQVDP